MSATQIGKTFVEACWITVRAWEDPVKLHPWWWTGPTYNQVMNGFRYITAFATTSGILACPPVTTPFPKVKLVNGASIEFRSRDVPKNLMGDTIAGGVVDEAGLLTEDQHSTISTRRSATLGPLHYIGNPGLFTGPFRRIAARAEAAGNPANEGHGLYSLHRWTWKDRHAALHAIDAEAAARYLAFIEEERAGGVAEFEFRRLYEAEWTEDEAAVFLGVMDSSSGPPLEVGAPGERYSIGVDVGQRVDYLVAIAIGNASRRADAMLRFRGIPYPQAADRLVEFQKKFPGTMTIETNGPGIALYQELRKRGARVAAFDTTGDTKEEAITGLATDLGKKLSLAMMPPLQHELSVYRYEKRAAGKVIHYVYGAPSGEHDDTVMALAIGYQALAVPVSGALELMRRQRAEREAAKAAGLTVEQYRAKQTAGSAA